ncbi:MAG: FGLLP motif-containing membrane protein [Candidatus Dormibacteraceae bacterium]
MSMLGLGLRVPALRWILFCALLAAVGFVGPGVDVQAGDSPPYSSGDVFAGVGGGKINHYGPSGNLIAVLDDQNSDSRGVCFDASGNLYATNFTADTASKFDSLGHLLQKSWGGSLSSDPEGCAIDRSGNIYIGEAAGDLKLTKFSSDGRVLATYQPQAESVGVDWIDIASDQCTIYYTSEGSTVKRFDVCKSTQLPDFAKDLPDSCYAIRIRENGEVLLGCSNQVLRLGANGSVVRKYSAASLGESQSLFALNLDTDGTSFWTAGFDSSIVYKVDIATGNKLLSFKADGVTGLAVFGEPLAGGPVGAHSTLANSVPDLGHVSIDLKVIGTNLLLALISLLAITFTKELFNSTVEENYAEILSWFAFLAPLARRISTSVPLRKNTIAAFLAFAAVGGFLYGFLEPQFGRQAELTAAMFLGMAAALAIVVLVHAFAAAAYARARTESVPELRFFPAVVVVAVVCVVVSRITNFQPGYIYGIFAAVAFVPSLSRQDQGRSVAAAAAAIFVLSLAAWLAWTPVRVLAGQAGAGFPILVLENLLVLTFVLGFEWLVFGLLPLRFLEGEKLFGWNRWIGMAILFVAMFVCLHILFDPGTRGRFVLGDNIPVLTWVGLFLAFGLFSIGIWAYFRYRARNADVAEA